MFHRTDPATGPADEDEEGMTPEEEAELLATIDRVQEEKRLALQDPGPTWREWFFHDHLKWWVGVGFLVVDVFLFSGWTAGDTFTPVSIGGAAACLAVAFYLEILIWRYLWRRPSPKDASLGSVFRPNWKALRQVGRWTPEAFGNVPARRTGPAPDAGPDPEEFL